MDGSGPANHTLGFDRRERLGRRHLRPHKRRHDYHPHLFVDKRHPKCPIYTLQHTHNEIHKKRFGVL